jgi:hypothetical protein
MTNVKVILAGLEAYGTMWDGIDMMAGKLNSKTLSYDRGRALNSTTRLCR